ncbi:MAG: hypothetical protein KFB95_08020 [Simkaniaceae bacterium]|nr:MAG: hypothetical protein KFB95_08020 [Simkaniaceae bacterium]
MSTNINTNIQTPPPASNPSQGAKDSRESSGPQGAPSTNPGAFQSGNGANTTAILTLIAALMELYECKNTAFVKQSQTESLVAKEFSQSQVALGNQEMVEQEVQGAFSIFSGAMSAVLLGQQIGNESTLGSQQGEIKASQDFVDNIGKERDQSLNDVNENGGRENESEIELVQMGEIQAPEEDQSEVNANKEKAKARLEEMITELKDGNYKMIDGSGKSAKAADPAKIRKGKLNDQEVLDTLANEPEMGNFKEAANQHIANKQAALKAETERVAGLLTKRQMGSQAISGMSQGAGQVGAGIEKQYQGEQNAANTLFSSAQQGFQKLAQETESQSDKDLQTAEGLVQLIPDIDKSNNAILSA